MKLLLAIQDVAFSRQASARLTSLGYEVTVASHPDALVDQFMAAPSATMVILGSSFMTDRVAETVAAGATHVPESRPYVLLFLEDATEASPATSAGIDDVLSYVCSVRELEARVRLAARIIDLEHQAASAREWLLFAATHDAVTGALTRAATIDTLDRELSRANRESHTVGVAAIGIDDADRIRAEYGATAHDLLVHEVARRVRDAVRIYDHIGRAGPETLLAILPGLGEAGSASVAARLRDRIEAKPIDIDVTSIRITCRIGVAVTSGVEMDSSSLLANAESALLLARVGTVAQSYGRLRAIPSISSYPTVRPSRSGLS